MNMAMSLVYITGLPSYLWDVVEWETHSMNVQLTNLQQLYDEIMSA